MLRTGSRPSTCGRSNTFDIWFLDNGATLFVSASLFWNSHKSGCLMIGESAVTMNSSRQGIEKEHGMYAMYCLFFDRLQRGVFRETYASHVNEENTYNEAIPFAAATSF